MKNHNITKMFECLNIWINLKSKEKFCVCVWLCDYACERKWNVRLGPLVKGLSKKKVLEREEWVDLSVQTWKRTILETFQHFSNTIFVLNFVSWKETYEVFSNWMSISQRSIIPNALKKFAVWIWQETGMFLLYVSWNFMNVNNQSIQS